MGATERMQTDTAESETHTAVKRKRKTSSPSMHKKKVVSIPKHARRLRHFAPSERSPTSPRKHRPGVRAGSGGRAARRHTTECNRSKRNASTAKARRDADAVLRKASNPTQNAQVKGSQHSNEARPRHTFAPREGRTSRRRVHTSRSGSASNSVRHGSRHATRTTRPLPTTSAFVPHLSHAMPGTYTKKKPERNRTRRNASCVSACARASCFIAHPRLAFDRRRRSRRRVRRRLHTFVDAAYPRLPGEASEGSLEPREPPQASPRRRGRAVRFREAKPSLALNWHPPVGRSRIPISSSEEATRVHVFQV